MNMVYNMYDFMHYIGLHCICSLHLQTGGPFRGVLTPCTFNVISLKAFVALRGVALSPLQWCSECQTGQIASTPFIILVQKSCVHSFDCI